MPSLLSVNINAVAFLRNRRDLPWPDPCLAAKLALRAGAKGITIHPRPDERHITATDVANLSAMIKNDFPGSELCLEGYPDDRFLKLVDEFRPQQVLFVPDDPQQTTSDHGWEIAAHQPMLSHLCGQMRDKGIRPALFIDPLPDHPALAADCGAERVEIYTGRYGMHYDDPPAAARELEQIHKTAQAAETASIGVNAGHDLTLENLPALVEKIKNLREVSIGHALNGDSLLYGLEKAVILYRRALGELVT